MSTTEGTTMREFSIYFELTDGTIGSWFVDAPHELEASLVVHRAFVGRVRKVIATKVR